ncbi:MAG: ribonuclease R [Thermincola sp.]|jgi:ribonuclease R|nr:ribonuclease R [Thermincola sp.]MDT3704726.1 ribonuclease R [Thermincola sp.]
MKEKVMEFMKREAYRPLSAAELYNALGFSDHDGFLKILEELENEGKVICTRKMKYGLPEKMNLVVGKLQGHANGFGFLIQDTPGVPDVFISADNMNSAMHNDRVIARLLGRSWDGPKQEGEIIRILSRANKTIVGTFDRGNRYGFVTPDENRISTDIFIPKGQEMNARTGDKVVVEITDWPERRCNPEGRIITIIGHKNEPGTDIESIIWKFGLPKEFPKPVLAEVAKIPMEVIAAQEAGRRNLRDLMMVTIDGEDAKDLDDAVSLEVLPNGNFHLGVHIADVGSYVTPGSALDKEAYKRGTSIYLVDRVIPMLPHELSNGICSLNPKVDRLALSVFMEIDNKGRVLRHDICESVININERMTYSNVKKILVDKDQELISKYDYLVETFNLMERLCLILNGRRLARGTVDFEFPEVKVKLDEKGQPIDILKYDRSVADRIIEEFMLVTNETVAQHFFEQGVPFVYRIHEKPDSEKVSNLNRFLFTFGLSIKGFNKIHPGAFQEVLKKVAGRPEERVISTVMLRTMKLARYSEENSGHFGLAAEHYCHFTSPIRRYPDLVIHRIIKEVLVKGQLPGQRKDKLAIFVTDASIQSSEREKLATEAERDSVDLKKVEFMQNKIGEEYQAIISGVTSFGIFVELDNMVEGLVHVTTMMDDFYEYDENKLSLTGRHTGRSFRIGDSVRVRLEQVNLDERKLDFELVENVDRPSKILVGSGISTP